uniref:Uncharacterized protein n=1 Tax=Candidatus Kentrum sp. TC TaxID=2126339 RepID=A0A450YA37_9GAMM|nr:MAG: hypothetical protein BECKTC1821E_GA0114239_100271 [Candidatus Kentron sp. TC]
MNNWFIAGSCVNNRGQERRETRVWSGMSCLSDCSDIPKDQVRSEQLHKHVKFHEMSSFTNADASSVRGEAPLVNYLTDFPEKPKNPTPIPTIDGNDPRQ